MNGPLASHLQGNLCKSAGVRAALARFFADAPKNGSYPR
jgi:hypothetical protein